MKEDPSNPNNTRVEDKVTLPSYLLYGEFHMFIDIGSICYYN